MRWAARYLTHNSCNVTAAFFRGFDSSRCAAGYSGCGRGVPEGTGGGKRLGFELDVGCVSKVSKEDGGARHVLAGLGCDEA